MAVTEADRAQKTTHAGTGWSDSVVCMAGQRESVVVMPVSRASDHDSVCDQHS